MSASSHDLGRQFDRRTKYQAALIVLYVALATALGLTYIKTMDHTRPFSYLLRGGATRAMFKSSVVVWPYLMSGFDSVPQLTSRHRDFWLIAGSLLLGSSAMFAFLCGYLPVPLTNWNVFWASLFEALAYGYAAHYFLDGIEP